MGRSGYADGKPGRRCGASTSGGEDGDIMIEDERSSWILSRDRYIVNSCEGIDE